MGVLGVQDPLGGLRPGGRRARQSDTWTSPRRKETLTHGVNFAKSPWDALWATVNLGRPRSHFGDFLGRFGVLSHHSASPIEAVGATWCILETSTHFCERHRCCILERVDKPNFRNFCILFCSLGCCGPARKDPRICTFFAILRGPGITLAGATTPRSEAA